MTKNQVWVSPHQDGWQVKSAGAEKAYRVVDTKKEAESIGKEVARNKGAEYIPQRKDGTIQNPNSYGNDPASIKDNKH